MTVNHGEECPYYEPTVIKSKYVCGACKYKLTGSYCGVVLCKDCKMNNLDNDEWKPCKCMTVYDGEECPYYEPMYGGLTKTEFKGDKK